MPIMDGLEFIRRVREFEVTGHHVTQTSSLSSSIDENEIMCVNERNEIFEKECSKNINYISDNEFNVTPNKLDKADKSLNAMPVKKRKRHIVIGMSANSDDETRKEALSVGMDSFIAKPFNVDKFCEVLIHARSTRVKDCVR